MRNRVSFSYLIGASSIKYIQTAATYSNTVTFQDSRNELFKGDTRFTALRGSSASYIHHDLGTSYIINFKRVDVPSYIMLYENEYDKYQYASTNIANDNNKKETSYTIFDATAYFGSSGIGYAQNTNIVYTYIHIDDNSYTYFPNFIEGLETYTHIIGKLPYGVSTNNIVLDKTSLQLAYGQYLSNNISYNIKGVYNNKRINGIGFSRTEYGVMNAGIQYNDSIIVHVYDENNDIISDTDIYNHLDITLPGMENSAYNVVKNTNNAILTINQSNKHIGSILVKISIDWKNNKFVTYHTLNFANIIDEIHKINYIEYNVNNNDSDDWRRQLLEGDHINIAHIGTMPTRANNIVELIIPNTYISTAYDSTITNTDHSLDPYKYTINTDVKQFQNLSHYNLDDFMRYTVSYNDGVSTHVGSTSIFKFVPNADSVKFYYLSTSARPSDFEHNEVTYLSNLNQYKTNIYGSFNISCSNNVAKNRYMTELNRTVSHNIIDVICTKYTYDGDAGHNINYINNLQFHTGALYNDALSYNAYQFLYKADEPGKYVFSYHTKNGIAENNNQLGNYPRLYFYDISSREKTIITYEGCDSYNLLDNNLGNSYSINTCSTLLPLVNTYIVTTSINNDNPVKTIAAAQKNIKINIDNSACTADIGFVDGNNNANLDINFVYETSSKRNEYRQINSDYNLIIGKIVVKTEIYINNTLYPQLTRYHTAPQANVQLPKIKLEDTSLVIEKIGIDFTLCMPEFGDIQSPFENDSLLDNFKLTVDNSNLDDYPYMDVTIYNIIDNKPRLFTTEIEINKENWWNNDTEKSHIINYGIKINRKGDGWDNLGFENAVINYTFELENGVILIDETKFSGFNHMLLLSNTINSTTGNNYYEQPYIFDLPSNNVMVEHFAAIDCVNGESLDSYLSYDYIISNRTASIRFTPKNNVNDKKLILRFTRLNGSQFTTNVWITKLKVSLNPNINTRYYIKDIDSSNILMQEILLCDSTNTLEHTGSIFINKFTAHDDTNILRHYKIYNDNNNINFVSYINTGLISDNINYSYNNVPDGVKLDIAYNNMIYEGSPTYVLIPQKTSNTFISVIHNNAELYRTNNISFDDITLPQWQELFTNGQNN